MRKFLSWDGDDVGDLVVRLIMDSDIKGAKKLSRDINDTQEEMIEILKKENADVVFSGVIIACYQSPMITFPMN